MVKTTEVEEIKQRGKNTQKNCILSQIGYLSPYRLVTHLEPEILDCEVKRVLGSITRDKASGGDGIPAELFKILKDDVVKVLHSKCQQVWKIYQWPHDWKRSVFIPIPKKDSAEECSSESSQFTYC